MPRTGVGGDKQLGLFHGGFRESEAEFFLGEVEDVRMIGVSGDLSRDVAFRGAAQDQNRLAKFQNDFSCQISKLFRGPMFGRSEGSSGIEADDFPAWDRGMFSPELFQSGSVLRGDCQFGLDGETLAARRLCQSKIFVEDRMGSAARGGGNSFCQKPSSGIAIEADPFPGSAEPPPDSTSQGIGEQYCEIEFLSLQLSQSTQV